MGDVKLAALIGLASPTITVALAAPVTGFLLGGVAASIVMIRGLLAGRGRAAGRAHLAFGPYLLAGYWVVVGSVALVMLSGSITGAGP